MKLRAVRIDNRKRCIQFVTRSGRVLPLPFSRLRLRPTAADRIAKAWVDPELGNEGITYRLDSGAEDSVHVDAALDYNRDPAHLAEIKLHLLTVEAIKRVDASGLSRREVARRLGTSVPQVYRLLDPANMRKTFVQLVALLEVVDCDVRVSVRRRRAAAA
ncbi:MAG: hypothetical protein U0842_24865 [Candidatus Binatia bacterium]